MFLNVMNGIFFFFLNNQFDKFTFSEFVQQQEKLFAKLNIQEPSISIFNEYANTLLQDQK